MAAVNPYSLEFEKSNASSKFSTICKVATGPKISLVDSVADLPKSSIIVGSI